MNVPARYWALLDDNRIECQVCPRRCRLQDGQRGLCFVRAREGDQMVLTTYGRSSGFCIDPVEKKPLNHFLPGTPILSFGTAGCNLTCKFCQNWDISKSRQLDTLQDEASPEKIAKVALQTGCKSVAYTYNDPTIFLEYAVDIAKACIDKGIYSVAVTAGYIEPAPRKEFYQHMHAANIDLKAFTETFYQDICGSSLSAVLDTLKYLRDETDVWFEITNLVIPTKNDSDKEFHEMTEWIIKHLGPDVPLHFSAFHPDWKMRDLPRTPAETLLRARRIAIEKGIRYVYVGNVHDKAASSTYCYNCNQLLIGRDWYALSDWQIDNMGQCNNCLAPVAGLNFKNGWCEKPGNWGAKRQPIQLNMIGD